MQTPYSSISGVYTKQHSQIKGLQCRKYWKKQTFKKLVKIINKVMGKRRQETEVNEFKMKNTVDQ